MSRSFAAVFSISGATHPGRQSQFAIRNSTLDIRYSLTPGASLFPATTCDSMPSAKGGADNPLAAVPRAVPANHTRPQFFNFCPQNAWSRASKPNKKPAVRDRKPSTAITPFPTGIYVDINPAHSSLLTAHCSNLPVPARGFKTDFGPPGSEGASG